MAQSWAVRHTTSGDHGHEDVGSSQQAPRCSAASLSSRRFSKLRHLEHLAPSATYYVNERINFLAQVTEFPLVQKSLAQMDAVIDQAILCAAGLPLKFPDSLTYLTTCTLRALRSVGQSIRGRRGVRRGGRDRGRLAVCRMVP